MRHFSKIPSAIEQVGGSHPNPHSALLLISPLNFLPVPLKLMAYGMLLCLDCFLYLFTFLPLRMLIALMWTLGWLVGLLARPPASYTTDVARMALFLVSYTTIVHIIDPSYIYHTIRGQLQVGAGRCSFPHPSPTLPHNSCFPLPSVGHQALCPLQSL